MPVELLVLNYNGRTLLAECLPSLLRAADASQHDCRVTVVDNASTDDSLAWLAASFPQVAVIRSDNLGLCSYNRVLARLDCRVAILLNNDIKLEERAIDPLITPLLAETTAGDKPCFMTAPLCWLFDGRTYEGLKTAVRWRAGLVQATALFAGHEAGIHQAGVTASAGAVLAVHRRKFLELGGFDPLYLPGRLEDLDFAFRGFQAGYQARYVPESVAYHGGCATFGPAFGQAGCDRLALRNTLLFQWKNLRHPAHLAQQAWGLPLRAAADVLRAPWAPRERRLAFLRALSQAAVRFWQIGQRSRRSGGGGLERDFFRRFHPRWINRSLRLSPR
ncbi:MAG: glycosyltransferase [Pirellulales bacterium]